MEDQNYKNICPQLEGVNIIKKLYQTKLSTIWIAKSNDQYFILKGKKRNELNSDDVEFLKRERAFLESGLDRQHFPFFIRSFKDNEYLYMALNLIEGCDLSSLIKENCLEFNVMSENFIIKKSLFLNILSQVVSLIEILHNNTFLYRDLKMNNLIINSNLEIFLIDFGFIKKIEAISNDCGSKTLCGTYHTMAPEIFKFKFENNRKGYNNKVDIYSLGVFIYELFTSKPPFPYVYNFQDENLQKYFQMISQGLSESHFESNFYFESSTVNNRNKLYNSNLELIDEQSKFVFNLRSLIKECMEINPDKRLSIWQIKHHPIFENNFDFFKDVKNFKFEYSDYISNIIQAINFNGEFISDYNDHENEDVFDNFF